MISYSNAIPLGRSEILEHERAIYGQQKINADELPEEVDLPRIFERKEAVFRDKVFNMPQNIFVLETEDLPPIVGRKILSRLFLEGKINAPNCSRITSSMLLGFLVNKQKSNDDISVQYHPFNNGEKITIFRELARDRLADICFPFRHLDHISKQEKRCSPTGWKISPEKAQNLANGEKHFRDYTGLFFRDIIGDGQTIYDPACSTGQFLASVKQKFPGCRTIGQDISKDMTEYAKDYVDEIYTGDAIESPLPDNSVDVMFLRFLNSEIVTSGNAHRLFNSLITKVKVGGLVVLFGHTPVLLNKSWFFRQRILNLLHSSGYNMDDDSIFQYYILEKS